MDLPGEMSKLKFSAQYASQPHPEKIYCSTTLEIKTVTKKLFLYYYYNFSE
jgi:hypothetical protein